MPYMDYGDGVWKHPFPANKLIHWLGLSCPQLPDEQSGVRVALGYGVNEGLQSSRPLRLLRCLYRDGVELPNTHGFRGW